MYADVGVQIVKFGIHRAIFCHNAVFSFHQRHTSKYFRASLDLGLPQVHQHSDSNVCNSVEYPGDRTVFCVVAETLHSNHFWNACMRMRSLDSEILYASKNFFYHIILCDVRPRHIWKHSEASLNLGLSPVFLLQPVELSSTSRRQNCLLRRSF